MGEASQSVETGARKIVFLWERKGGKRLGSSGAFCSYLFGYGDASSKAFNSGQRESIESSPWENWRLAGLFL